MDVSTYCRFKLSLKHLLVSGEGSCHFHTDLHSDPCRPPRSLYEMSNGDLLTLYACVLSL